MESLFILTPKDSGDLGAQLGKDGLSKDLERLQRLGISVQRSRPVEDLRSLLQELERIQEADYLILAPGEVDPLSAFYLGFATRSGIPVVLYWLRPHWPDLERIYPTAASYGSLMEAMELLEKRKLGYSLPRENRVLLLDGGQVQEELKALALERFPTFSPIWFPYQPGRLLEAMIAVQTSSIVLLPAEAGPHSDFLLGYCYGHQVVFGYGSNSSLHWELAHDLFKI